MLYALVVAVTVFQAGFYDERVDKTFYMTQEACNARAEQVTKELWAHADEAMRVVAVCGLTGKARYL